MRRFFSLPALLLLTCLFTACAYHIQVERAGPSLVGKEHFFVVANSNDNHALNHQIVAALRARGLQAETGPLTMMPDETQAVLTYEDHWAWDFGDHLIYLQVGAKDRKTSQPLSRSTFSVKFPTRTPVTQIVGDLVEHILTAGPPLRP